MKKRLTTVFIILLCAVLAASSGVLIARGIQSRRDAAAYDYAQLLLHQEPAPPLSALPDLPPQEEPAHPAQESPEPEPEPQLPPEPTPEQEPEAQPLPELDAEALYLLSCDIAPLQAENSDVIGWIYIPGTPINYPLLQGENNEYYLKYNWQKQRTRGGSIFMDYTCSADFTDFSTILYGHRMSDTTMFNSLLKYASQEYYTQHPKVYIRTEQGVFVYEVFAAFQAAVTDPVYWLQVENLEHRTRLIGFCLENSVISTDVRPAQDDSILVLSTCIPSGSKEFRWVVTAVQTCALWVQ